MPVKCLFLANLGHRTAVCSGFPNKDDAEQAVAALVAPSEPLPVPLSRIRGLYRDIPNPWTLLVGVPDQLDA